MADMYWVTWQDTPDTTAAQKSAIIWGPQAHAPAQLQGYFQAGPFKTKADAEDYEKQIGVFATDVSKITSDLNPLTGLAAVGDFFSRLSNPNTWLRVAEFGIAAVLIFAGINHLMGNPAGRAVRTGIKGAAIIK